MKKIYFIFLVFQLPLMLLAQQPFGKNATWTMSYSEAGYYGFRQITYSHDTIINGEAWQKFAESGVSEIRTGPGPNDISQGKYSGATFQYLFLTRNDSVFRMEPDGTSYLLYDYSAGVGDKWQFANWDTSASCLDTPMVTVVAIGYDTVKGEVLKYWDLQDEMDTIDGQYVCSSGACMGGRLYERLGMTFSGSYFRPVPNLCNGGSFQLFQYGFRCYEDDNLSVIHFNNCEQWAWLDVEESTLNSEFKIYPNPNETEYLNIESLNEFDEIVVTNISGQVVLESRIPSALKAKVFLEIEAGLYFIQLKNKGKPRGLQKLVVQ